MLTAFQNYLSSNGISFNREDDTAISFEKEGLHFLFIYNDSDPYYFRLILPNVATLTDENRQRMHEIANTLNLRFKVAKVIILDNNVWVSAEQFVYSRERLNDLFTRAISLLALVIEHFRTESSQA